MRVGGRIPDFVIDTVRDADESVAAHTQKPVETVAVLGRLNLKRVTTADGRERVRRHQPGLQGRGHAVFEKDDPLIAVAEADAPRVGRVKQALVGEIVN